MRQRGTVVALWASLCAIRSFRSAAKRSFGLSPGAAFSATWPSLDFDRVADTSTDRVRFLREVFDDAPAMVTLTRGPDHVYEYLNRAALENSSGSRSDVIGRSLRASRPELVADGYVELYDGVYRTGKRLNGCAFVVMMETRWSSSRAPHPCGMRAARSRARCSSFRSSTRRTRRTTPPARPETRLSVLAGTDIPQAEHGRSPSGTPIVTS